MTVTIKDVARRARVSTATVSRVLNGSFRVDPELRRRVLEAAQTLQYRPSRLARNLRTKSTNTIAFVIPDIENDFFISLARGIEEVAFRAGYTLLLCNTDDNLQRESAHFGVLRDEMVAGIILCPTDEDSSGAEADKLMQEGISVVAVDRLPEGIQVDIVLSDNFSGSRRAVSYLIETGHRRIGLIAGPDRYAPGRERRLGYEQALLDSQLPIDPDLIKITNFKASGAEAAAQQLLDLPAPPTALFICSGHSALGALSVVHRRELRIPRDISIVIFDDPDWLAAYNPPITAISQNAQEIGATAANLLVQRIRGKQGEMPQERRLPTRLVIRESCAAPSLSLERR